MKEYTNMTPSELLTLLLDGELDSSQEATLFAELAKNTELQDELREMLAIRQSVQHDFEAFSPPPDAAQGVFDRVGLDNPSAVPAGATAGAESGFFGILRKRWWASAIGLLLITFVGYNLLDSENNTTIAADKSKPSKSKATRASEKVPFVSSMAVAPQKSNAEENTAQPNNTSPANNSNISVVSGLAQTGTTWGDPDDEKTNEATPAQNDKASPQNSQNIIAFNTISASANAEGPVFMPSQYFGAGRGDFSGCDRHPPEYSPMLSAITPEKTYGISLYYNGLYSISEAELNLDEGNSPFVSEFNAGIFLDATTNFKLGFEIGYESFGHIYTSDALAQNETYDQKPLIFCLGVGARHEMSYLDFHGARPFIHASYASTELGHLGRCMVGLEYIIPQRLFFGGKLGISAGYEGSMLLYETRDSKWLTAGKNGLIIGGSIHF
jgi:hypothetical protein